MAGAWLPPTIEEDEEISIHESDSEDEVPLNERSTRQPTSKRQGPFEDDFSFPAADSALGEGGWEVEDEVMKMAERKKDAMVTSLDSKILRAIEQRQLKVYSQHEAMKVIDVHSWDYMYVQYCWMSHLRWSRRRKQSY